MVGQDVVGPCGRRQGKHGLELGRAAHVHVHLGQGERQVPGVAEAVEDVLEGGAARLVGLEEQDATLLLAGGAALLQALLNITLDTRIGPGVGHRLAGSCELGSS